MSEKDKGLAHFPDEIPKKVREEVTRAKLTGKAEKRKTRSSKIFGVGDEGPKAPLPYDDIDISPEQIKRIKIILKNFFNHILQDETVTKKTVRNAISQIHIPKVKIQTREAIQNIQGIYDVPKSDMDKLRINTDLTIAFNQIISDLENKK